MWTRNLATNRGASERGGRRRRRAGRRRTLGDAPAHVFDEEADVGVSAREAVQPMQARLLYVCARHGRGPFLAFSH